MLERTNLCPFPWKWGGWFRSVPFLRRTSVVCPNGPAVCRSRIRRPFFVFEFFSDHHLSTRPTAASCRQIWPVSKKTFNNLCFVNLRIKLITQITQWGLNSAPKKTNNLLKTCNFISNYICRLILLPFWKCHLWVVSVHIQF